MHIAELNKKRHIAQTNHLGKCAECGKEKEPNRQFNQWCGSCFWEQLKEMLENTMLERSL